jgi:hypothetical protein
VGKRGNVFGDSFIQQAGSSSLFIHPFHSELTLSELLCRMAHYFLQSQQTLKRRTKRKKKDDKETVRQSRKIFSRQKGRKKGGRSAD